MTQTDAEKEPMEHKREFSLITTLRRGAEALTRHVSAWLGRDDRPPTSGIGPIADREHVPAWSAEVSGRTTFSRMSTPRSDRREASINPATDDLAEEIHRLNYKVGGLYNEGHYQEALTLATQAPNFARRSDTPRWAIGETLEPV